MADSANRESGSTSRLRPDPTTRIAGIVVLVISGLLALPAFGVSMFTASLFSYGADNARYALSVGLAILALAAPVLSVVSIFRGGRLGAACLLIAGLTTLATIFAFAYLS